MGTIQKIMVAVGLTEYSEETIRYAVSVAECTQAELVVASVINDRDVQAVGTIAAMGYDVQEEHYVDGVKQERMQMLEKILAGISYPTAKIRSVFKVGNPLEELLKTALEEKVDLIVMGIKGRTDLEHVLVGSLAEKIFRRSPVPVLSYRDEKNARRLRQHIHLESAQ